jgi:hypothetical protein
MKANRPTLKIRFQIVFLSLLTVCSAPASEPVFNGQPLSDWLVERDTAAQQDAIRQMGTSCIPTLLDILAHISQINFTRPCN